MTPYDLTKGRINFRHKDVRAGTAPPPQRPGGPGGNFRRRAAKIEQATFGGQEIYFFSPGSFEDLPFSPAWCLTEHWRAAKRIGSSLEADPIVHVSNPELFEALIDIDLPAIRHLRRQQRAQRLVADSGLARRHRPGPGDQ